MVVHRRGEPYRWPLGANRPRSTRSTAPPRRSPGPDRKLLVDGQDAGRAGGLVSAAHHEPRGAAAVLLISVSADRDRFDLLRPAGRAAGAAVGGAHAEGISLRREGLFAADRASDASAEPVARSA